MKVVVKFTLLIVLSLLVGCGGGGGSDSSGSSLIISGTIIGDGIVKTNWIDRFINKFVDTAYAADDRPDKIIVISNTGEELNEFTINEDGSFVIDISQLSSNSFMMFIKNTVSNKYYGHIKLGTQNVIYSLDSFDKSMFLSDVDLGIIDVNDLTGPTLEELDSFSAEDKDILTKMARNDDGLALYLNKLMNNNISSSLRMEILLGNQSSLKNTFFDIESFTWLNFKGMNPAFHYYGDDVESLESIIFYPPSNIMYKDITVGDSGYDSYADEYIGMVRDVSSNYIPELGIVTIETPYIDRLPEGYWILDNNDNGNNLGSFVFSGATPFDSNDHFTTFVPALKINTDSEDNVTSLSLKMYRYGDTGFELINKDYFDAITYDLAVFYAPYVTGRTIWIESFDINDDGTELTFKLNEEINIEDSRYIVRYKIGQAEYLFYVE